MITQNGIALPALYLYSLNASFVNKHIHLPPGQRVKIGRQTNAKSVPGERNGFFDSKVLSRAHAEVWEEGGKIFIKDVKSSNGTFINSERLSPESAESEPFELKTDDIVEFGIDIVGEDNKTVVHHKVAARVVCVFTPEDAAAAARAEQHQATTPAFHGGHPHQQHQQHQQPAAGANNPNAFFRRPGAAQQVAGIGGMGGGPARAPGKNALTFDHILNRLQGELQKSRETGAELHALTGAMGEIHDSLGASALHGEHKALAQGVPPVPPPQPAQREQERSSVNDGALAELQAQLNATQRALADHVDKVRSLEAALAGQEAVRAEVAALREMLDSQREHAQSSSHHDDERRQEEQEDDDDDDARSIATVTPHELETVTEEEEEAEQEPEQPAMRPRTPEPNMHYASASSPPSSSTPASPPAAPAVLPAEIDARLSALSAQLESALEQGRSLSAQHAAAQSTITTLASRLAALEGVRGEWSAWEAGAHAREDAQIGRIEKMVKETVGGFKAAWERERESERAREREEREKERAADREERAKERELLGVHAAIKKGENDEKRTGLVTPPSPRSVSADSTGKRRRRRASTSRGRRGRSTDSTSAAEGHDEHEHEDSSSEGASSSAILDEKASVASVATGGLPLPRKRGAMLAWLSDAEADVDHDAKAKYGAREGGAGQTSPGTVGKPVQQWTTVGGLAKHQVEASIGLILVGVAVGAVMWRVTPE
ncbi:unnamed protein product [Peniophora sp. CBMAI 1063]|nr:unnamed protein product [Peniophora sp. CBMAI 1063]